MKGESPELRAVAGCLFEVVLPAGTEIPWTWTERPDEVTLLADECHGNEHRFRFRAEVACAGAVRLTFGRDGKADQTVLVRIAPERWPTA